LVKAQIAPLNLFLADKPLEPKSKSMKARLEIASVGFVEKVI
jgi:hypothetical protein